MKDYILKLAINQAQKVIHKHPQGTRFRLGAVVFKKHVLSTGFNKPFQTHPLSKGRYKAKCAEFDALIGLTIEQLNGASLLVIRLNAIDQLVLSKPCNNCMDLIQTCNIRHLYWTDSTGELVYRRL